MKFLRKEDVLGKEVISSEGKLLGTVNDLAFSIDGSVALVVGKADGQPENIALINVSGIADFVVLKPTPVQAPVPQPAPTVCPRCGSQLRPNVKFCTTCGNMLPTSSLK